MSITPINSLPEFKEIIQSDIVIIFFSASWSYQCTYIYPSFEGEAHQFPKIPFYMVDFDTKQKDIVKEVNLRNLPTFKIYKKGEMFDELPSSSSLGLQMLLEKASRYIC